MSVIASCKRHKLIFSLSVTVSIVYYILNRSAQDMFAVCDRAYDRCHIVFVVLVMVLCVLQLLQLNEMAHLVA